MVREGRYPEGAAAYSVVVACEIEARDQAAVNGAVMRVEAAMTPAEPEQVRRWIAALSVATRGARGSETDALAALELYSGALLRYPADVAKAACTALAVRPPRSGTNWFPSLSEVVAECERLVGTRRALLAGLRGWRPKTADEQRAEERRDWLLLEAQAREEASRCRRGDPDRHSELIEFADAARLAAWELRTGAVQ